MRTSESTANIVKAFVSIQAELVNPKAKEINPFFKSKYVKLNQLLDYIKPVTVKHGCVHSVGTMQGTYVIVRLMHVSGEWLEFDGLIIRNAKGDAQGEKSGYTYATRASLEQFFGLSEDADDDDGNRASANKTNWDRGGEFL